MQKTRIWRLTEAGTVQAEAGRDLTIAPAGVARIAPYDVGPQTESYCRTLLLYDHVSRQRPHSHRFIELMLSLDGSPIVVEYDEDTVASVTHVVAPLRRHAILQCGAVARMYVAIGMRAIDPLRDVRIDDGYDRCLREKVSALRGTPPSAASERITLDWQKNWLPGFDKSRRIEPRIERAVRHIDVRLEPKTTRAVLSRLVDLSPSRFAALFLQEMGMPLGRYIIWRRLLIALEYLKVGDTTTQAAAYAGFSDAPHLCRCYRSAFGSPPSLLPIAGIIQHGAGLEFLTRR